MGDIAAKILIGVATAAIWFVLSHAARAEQVYPEVCGYGPFIAGCVDR
jgi:hypothetical protein